MPRRHPATLALVGAAHAALAWALWSPAPARPPLVGRTAPQAATGLLSVVLHPAARPAAAQPTQTEPAAARPLRRVAVAPERAVAAAHRLPPIGAPSRPPADRSTDGSADHEVASGFQPVTPPTDERLAAAPADPIKAAPALPSARLTQPAPAKPAPTVSAHADRYRCPPAPHPAALRERGIEGAVVLRVQVDVQGRVADVQVLAGSGWRLLDQAALQQVRACRFIPATQDGLAIDSWVEFPVRFALAG